jgi:putative tryptophan/tyrosine transport system substrate-binding protein
VVPAARIIALLVNPANPNGDALSRRVQVAARTLGLELYVLNASTEREFDPAFATLTHVQAGGLVIATDGLFLAHGEQLGAYVLRHRMPAIFAYHEFAAAGGLMSYGGSLTDQYRLLGAYAGRILKGESPADLPVQQVTKIELGSELINFSALTIRS